MKPDDFENQLQRQPLRAVPSEWRAEILQAARASVSPRASRLTPHALPWWREWLWPSPQAWAGLAAVWLVILGLNATTSSQSVEIAKQTSKPSPEAETTLAAQRRELARLLDNFSEPTPAPKAGPPGPRSENVSPPRV
jgi:hypothetical protein